MAQPQFGPETLMESGFEKLISQIEAEDRSFIPEGEEFTEKIIKDEKGKPIINHRVHKEFHWFVREAVEEGHNRVMIVGAFLLGKSEQIAIGYILVSAAMGFLKPRKITA